MLARQIRRFTVLVPIVAATLTSVGGVATATTPDTTPGTTTGTTESAEDVPTTFDPAAFPVTVETVHGEVTIDEAPERIMVLDFGYLDAVRALGVEPGVVSLGGSDLADLPWLEPVVDPATIDPDLFDGQTLNLEAITAAQPDLILGAWWVIDEEQFDLLSQIAPTVIGREAGNEGWEVRLDLTAEALGLSDLAEQVHADVDGAYAELAEQVPELQGRTYNYTGFGPDYGGFFWGNGSWLEPIGLVPNDNQDNSQISDALSTENMDQIDADVWAIYPYPADQRDVLESDPRFELQPAVENGLVIWLDQPLANATNNAGPLSLQWAVEQVTPILVDGSASLDTASTTATDSSSADTTDG